jgi:membrane-associated HD superfamily phosphohydrolase
MVLLSMKTSLLAMALASSATTATAFVPLSSTRQWKSLDSSVLQYSSDQSESAQWIDGQQQRSVWETKEREAISMAATTATLDSDTILQVANGRALISQMEQIDLDTFGSSSSSPDFASSSSSILTQKVSSYLLDHPEVRAAIDTEDSSTRSRSSSSSANSEYYNEDDYEVSGSTPVIPSRGTASQQRDAYMKSVNDNLNPSTISYGKRKIRANVRETGSDSLRGYIKTMCDHELLNKNEEIILAREIQILLQWEQKREELELQLLRYVFLLICMLCTFRFVQRGSCCGVPKEQTPFSLLVLSHIPCFIFFFHPKRKTTTDHPPMPNGQHPFVRGWL